MHEALGSLPALPKKRKENKLAEVASAHIEPRNQQQTG
jgi:hypothetical protein